MLVKRNQSYFFSSNPSNGAQNVSVDGSRFNVTLNSPIRIPKDSVSCELGLTQASIWNTSPNIAASFSNNIFSFTTSNAANPGAHAITISDGLYSLSGLNQYIQTAVSNLGLPSNLITLSGEDSTQRTILTFLEAGDQVDFTAASSVRLVLGFNSRLSPLVAQPAGYSDYSDSSASFNRNNSLLITTDLISEGIPVNSTALGIIGAISIDVPPGSQINYAPRNIIWADASELIGSSKSNFSFSLVNQSLQAVPTTGETYDFVLVIKYVVNI